METNNKNAFEYTYSAKRQEEVESIRKKYMPKEEDKLEQLRKLDRSVETTGTMAAITVGTIGTLVLGIGMSLALVWTEQYMAAGIVIGVAGMIILAMAYPIYKTITKKQREKIGPQILALTEELLK